MTKSTKWYPPEALQAIADKALAERRAAWRIVRAELLDNRMELNALCKKYKAKLVMNKSSVSVHAPASMLWNAWAKRTLQYMRRTYTLQEIYKRLLVDMADGLRQNPEYRSHTVVNIWTARAKREGETNG